MLTFRNTSTKSKTNSHKHNSGNKIRRIRAETEIPREYSVGTQTLDSRVDSSKSSSKSRIHEKTICNSFENIMNWSSNGKQETNSMSKTDFANLYSMYKNLLKKVEMSSEVHAENYRLLLNEFHNFRTETDERERYRNSFVAAILTQHKMKRRVHVKRSAKVYKRLEANINKISFIISQFQRIVDNMETNNWHFESKIQEPMAATNGKQPEKKVRKSKKASFCCCN